MTRRNHRLTIFLLAAPAVGFVGVFLLAVLAMTILQSVGLFSFSSETEIGFVHWVRAIEGQTWDSLVYSVRTALVSALGSLLVAFPLALYLRRLFAGRGMLNALLRVPLFVPALVAAFLILNVFSFHGIVNELLILVGLIDEPLRVAHDEWGIGVVLIQIWKNVPFQTLILAAVLANIPADLEAAARNLGAGRFRVFRHVLLPLSIPGILTAVTLVFIGVLGDYAINSIAGPLYPPSLSIRMYLLGKNFGEWGQAGVIAVLIIASSLVFAGLLALAGRLAVRVAR